MLKRTVLMALGLTAGALAQQSHINHRIMAVVDPAEHAIAITDEITIPADQLQEPLTFLLISDLTVSSETPGVTLTLDKKDISGQDTGMDVEDFSETARFNQNRYKMTFADTPRGDVVFTVKMQGKIYYPIKNMGQEYARSFSQSPGLICDEGVYLGGSTYWVPWFNDGLITFDLEVSLPSGWDAVSQGKRTRHERIAGRQHTAWNAPMPMEEVYLIAAQFNEYHQSAGAVDVMAFLRTPDENLANKYLETTAQYLELYRKLIGPYPFSKFALIENFWETGYGMASFTLLGPQVIRFPFILHSSYPHELLHNYWGNSVYVDFESGNWCEGITAYMADHLIKEQRGQGDDYRRSTIQKFTDYVTPQNDFPLTQFLSRNDAASEAIGYGKSMMAMNMLRNDLGDEVFVKAYQKFYRDNKYRFASFDDIRAAFEAVSGKDLKAFFEQWTTRTGAPALSIGDVKSVKQADGYDLHFTLEQTQDEAAFTLNVPVAVSLQDTILLKNVTMTGKNQGFTLSFRSEPLYLQIDPMFQLFRKLHYYEIPPALSKIYGSEKILIVLPSKADEVQIADYAGLAQKWAADKSKEILVKSDSEIDKLPADMAVWIFGRNNRFSETIAQGINGYDAEITDDAIRFGKTVLTAGENSFVVAVRHPENPNTVAAWLTMEKAAAADGLARKLLHYGKYSYLAFKGDEPTNIAKGQWRAVNSPLARRLADAAGSDFPTQLPRRRALAYLAPVFSAERMLESITYLADEKLQGRGLGTKGIDIAADYIKAQFEAAGLKPGGDDSSYFQCWTGTVDADSSQGTLKNVIGVIPGTDPAMAGESVVVSAHYDHLGRGWPDCRKGNEGKIHPGADDNASGVAVMLELAQMLGKSLKPQRSIVFVAFTAEENGLVGSRHYVKHSKAYPAAKVIGNLNLDTVGRLFDSKLMVLNTSSAREWKFIFMGAGYVTGVDGEMVAQDIAASDQVAFIEAGLPGVQFFTGAHSDYHSPGDTVEKIDPAGLVKVAAYVREGILYLAERKEPLAFTGSTQPAKPAMDANTGSTRRASTGSMPDFSFSGKGVRLGAVPEGSAAAKAGLQKGDILIKLGSHDIVDLRGYSNALKAFKPGDSPTVTYIRDGSEQTAQITLSER